MKPCNGQWIGGLLKQIDGGEAYVYGVNSNNDIFSRPIDGSGSWCHIPGKLTDVTASGYREIYGVNAAGNIFRCPKPCIGEWGQIVGSLKQCDATFNAVFGVNRNDDIFRFYTGI